MYARQPNNADKWKIEKISRLSQLNQKPEFKAAAVVFAVPPETKKQVIPIKRNWFKTAKQVLKIEYLNNNNQKQIIEYEFNLHWYQYMSGWDKIVSIT